MPDKLKEMDRRHIVKPEIRPDPNIEHAMKLNKHLKSASSMKHSASKRSGVNTQRNSLF